MSFISKTDPAAIITNWFVRGWRACFDRSQPLSSRILCISLALLPLAAIVALLVVYLLRDGAGATPAPGNPPVQRGTP